MKRLILLVFVSIVSADFVFCQLVSDGRTFQASTSQRYPSNPASRSSQKPTSCTSDTSYFPYYGATGFNSVTVRSGSSLGQYYGASQAITVSGFRFFAYSLNTIPARAVNVRLRCNLYKAGADSLPTGLPLASDTITVDTVMGSSIPLERIERNAVFSTPVTVNYGYIIVVECDSINVGAALVTNNWLNRDGRRRNLGCGSVSGKWYRCLQLNIGGNTFDADMQLLPFVKYHFGTDFTTKNDCYNFGDTVKFANAYKSNVSGEVYYNYYMYYNLPQFSHRWSFDNNFGSTYMVEGFYKPGVKRNFDVQLISTVYSYTSGQCNDTVVKTVYFKPDRPSLKKPAGACIGDTVSIDVLGDAGAILGWYHKLSDPTPFQTGNTLKISNVQANDTFYIQAVNGDCKSSFLRVEFAVSAYPNFPTTKNDSICQGAVANLGATSNLGKLEWFSASSGGAPVFQGNSIQTGKLFADTNFYVQANNNGCINKGGRAMVKAFVNNSFAPDKPVVITDTFMCLRPSSSIDIMASQTASDTLRWFHVPTGGVPFLIGEVASFSPSVRGTQTLYVETWNGICGSGRSPVNIHVADYPTIFGLRGDTICPNDPAEPFLSVPWGTANWYQGKINPTPVYVGETPTFAGLLSNTRYFLETQEDGCFSGIIDSIDIVVNTPPVPSLAKADAVCAKANGNMSVTVPYGKVNWYYALSDETPFHTGSSVAAGLILGNVTYYYETVNQGCKSPKVPLTVVMKPRPTAGFTWILQWQNRLICTPISTNGLTMSWNWGDGLTSTGLPAVHQYASKGNYNVRLVATSTTNGCRDTADIPVVIDHTSIKNNKTTDLQVFPNPVKSGHTLYFPGTMANVFRVQLIGLDGRCYQQLETHTPQFDLMENLPSGVYILRIATGASDYDLRLLVTE